MSLLENTREICRVNKIYPAYSKGQNFLVNEEVYDKVAGAADLKKTDTVLEVGPGLGFLTAKLAQAAKKVLAVELDDNLAKYLEEKFSAEKIENIKIINKDILKADLQSPVLNLQNLKYKIVSNLPYNITSFFLRKFLSNEPKPELLVLLLQKEVAERICAKPGDMSLLALSVQFFAEPEIVAYVPKEDFWPKPKVDSAIIRIMCHSREGGNPVKSAGDDVRRSLVKQGTTDEKQFFRLAKIGFSAKRKMLKNNLANGLHVAPAETEKMLIAAGFDPKIRAEDLGVEDWKRIIKNMEA